MASTKPDEAAILRVALFGPQRTQWTQQNIADLQFALHNDTRLAFIRDALAALPDLSELLLHEGIKEAGLRLDVKLETLRAIATDPLVSAQSQPENFSSIELAVLTVVAQLVDFIHQHGAAASLDHFDDAQGFCLGFLAAAVFATASSWHEFKTSAANAIRLAACIGWIVDADQQLDPTAVVSVRCKTPSDRALLDTILDSLPGSYISCITDETNLTVTIPRESEAAFSRRLRDADIGTTSLGMHASYHSQQKHAEAAQRLSRLCVTHPDILQLPDAQTLRLPLRSTATTEILTAGALHDIAIELILCQRAHWFQTVKKTLAALPEQSETQLVALGSDACIPRSLGRNSNCFLRSSVPDAAVVDEIAVVGMSCRFPRSDNLAEFWQLLHDGESAVGTIPLDRYNPALLLRSPKLAHVWGNFLSNPDAFDHKFFGISGREAKSMDPQQRLALQVSYEALASAGYFSRSDDDDTAARQQKDVGVYLGVGAVDYEQNIASRDATAFSATGTLRAFITGRVSHFFGWDGPSMTVDTACSSSSVAIHAACKAVLGGECSMALAGGVNVIASPSLHQNLAAASFLNPNGASRAFDDKAEGYCRGEGAGVIVLKRLSQALADGDQVLGVIAASAVNHGSNCSPITVPHSKSQSILYQRVLADARIKPEEVTYVEAHGTGTQVGDPIEYESVRSTFSSPARKQQLFLGSVKDNIGHIESASGVAGVIKVLLMMQYGMIPKQANFASLNHKIKASPEDRITIPTRTLPWTSPSRIALVNNYGAAGSNAAILVRQVSKTTKQHGQNQELNLVGSGDYPILLAAKTVASLKAYTDALKLFLSKERPSLASVAYSLAQEHDVSFKYRIGFVAGDVDGAIATLSGTFDELVRETAPKPVVLCFGGQTGRTVTVSREIYDRSHLLKKHLDECNKVCKKLGLASIFPGILQAEPVDDLVSLHCRLLALQVASARTWLDSGLRVDTLIGHSFGQISALCVAGSMSLEDAFYFVAGRARLIRDSWGDEAGSMLAIECDKQDVERVAEDLELDVACYNGPRSFVLAGNAASIAKALEVCKSFKTTELKNSHAYHSHLTEGIMRDLHEIAKSITIRQPRMRIETCSPEQSWTTVTAEAIAQHTRQPVHFHDAVARIAKRLPSAIWVEAGSSTPIVPMVRRALTTQAARTGDVLLPMQLEASEALSSLAKSISELWRSGSSAQFWPFHHSSAFRYQRLNLPPYQFEKNSHWLSYEPPVSAAATVVSRVPELVKMVKDGNTTGEYEFVVDTANDVFQLAVRGHAVTGHSLCPASMYIEVVARAASIIANHADTTQYLPHVEGLTMLAPLGVGNSDSVIIRLQKQHEGVESWAFTLSSHKDSLNKSTDDAEKKHATGLFRWDRADDVARKKRFQLLGRLGATRTLSQSTVSGISGAMVYKLFSDVVDYASYYRGVESLSAADNEAIGKVKVPLERPSRLDAGICDPIILDNFLQVSGIHTNCFSFRGNDLVLMCTAVEEIIFSAAFLADRSDAREWVVYTRFETDAPANTRTNDIFVRDAKSGDLVLAVLGASFRGVPFKSLSKNLARLNKTAATVASVTPVGDDEEDSGYSTISDGIETEKKPDSASRSQEVVAEAVQVAVDNSSEVLVKVRNMFSEIIEIPVEEILPTSSLDDLGIDSLLVTEVLAEIHGRFGLRISQGQFSKCADVQAVSVLVGGVESKSTTAMENVAQSVLLPVSTQRTATQQDNAPEHEPNTAAAARDAFTRAPSSYDTHADTTGFTDFYTQVWPTLSDLAVQYVVMAFASLGCDLKAVESGTTIPAVQALPQHEKLMVQLHNMLISAGLIFEKDGLYQRTSQPVHTVSASILHEKLLKRFPRHASEIRLLHVTAHKLAECLSGAADPVALLFGDASTRALLGDVYQNAPMFKTGSLLLTEYLTSLLASIGSKRELRILELGAGTGGTTKFVVNELAKLRPEAKFTYTFTDLSSSLVATARRTFKNWDFMEYKVVDIEKVPPLEMLGTYDIVLSTNCIHATRDLVQSTTHIRQMLKPDGLLCLVELTHNLSWFDLVFGLLEGWWRFTDGRTHALATVQQWKASLQEAGFRWVDWSRSATRESELLRVITASPCELPNDVAYEMQEKNKQLRQTIPFKEVDGQTLYADVYFPRETVAPGTKLPAALMIHGGGHIMLSRHDIRPDQTDLLLASGFLPISIDYRLCPEVTLPNGPMADAADALHWIRTTLPALSLARPDIAVDPTKVVAIGWSTGGHLATTLAWTATAASSCPPPDAILAFYAPLDYQDPFWTRPNMPQGISPDSSVPFDTTGSVFDAPITAYNVAPGQRALGGWMAESDARSRLALHMNTQGRTLQVLLRGSCADIDDAALPREQDVVAVSPLAQARLGRYRTPTFLVHPLADDLIPWEQAERMWGALQVQGVAAELRLLKGTGVKHLFDLGGLRKVKDEEAKKSVLDGYAFLCRHVGLSLKAECIE